ncbi:MAG: MaoC family dehydratase N-terminal domain-containing protein [Pseudoclavibacter sp.]|nr:MaoC family dehydratase N-terminal domain-containing protein [Pseudoclavibacter sp.]
MSVHQDFAGRRYRLPEPYLVGREHLRSFARAVFASSPVHLDPAAARAAGYPDLVAPATFPAVLQDMGLQLFLADSGIELSHIVHGEQAFEYTRPVVAGDELHTELLITSVKPLGGNAMIGADAIVTDARGEHVVTARATLVVRGEAAA